MSESGIVFTIFGQIHGGKNNMRVNRRGQHYPDPKFRRWRDQVVADLRFLLLQMNYKTINGPCRMWVRYWSGDRRWRDVTAMLDSVFHCLERAGMVADDSLIETVEWYYEGYDKENPRAEIKIAELEVVEA